MRVERADAIKAKGWYAGPWNSTLPIAVGYANAGIDEPHFHTGITEIHLVACGKSVIRVEQETIILSTGDVIIVEAGEAHSFLESSPDYLHFVIHVSNEMGEKVKGEKTLVTRDRLGL